MPKGNSIPALVKLRKTKIVRVDDKYYLITPEIRNRIESIIVGRLSVEPEKISMEEVTENGNLTGNINILPISEVVNIFFNGVTIPTEKI